MISPYVRRLRLGAEMRAMRATAGLTAAQLGKSIGRSRADISRLENGHVADQADVMKLLDELDVDGVLAGDAGRKRMFRRPGGPALEVIIDEVAIRRLTAPPEIVKEQLYHLATAVNSDPRITLRVLPVDARVASFTVPRCTFWLYTYADPGDPSMVIIDTVTSDLILSDPTDVAPYDQLYERLREATLPAADSIELLTRAAAELPNELRAKEC